jgi:radical SAM protein with 4Fe4S-binding SPASM domain
MQFDRVYIEISNICNLQCSFCPEVLRPKKLMDPEQFRLVIQQVKPFTSAVTLHVMGEPLAHPKFSQFLEILEAENVPLILTTNGILLERQRALLLKSPIIKQINFSIHSFFDNFPGKNIRDYLVRLTEFSKVFILHHPESFVNFRLWNLPQPTDSLTVQNQSICSELRTLFSDPILPENVNVLTQKSYRLDRHIKMHFDTQFEWPSLNSLSPEHEGFCYGLRNQIAILTEGTVVPCCLDKEAVINLGSIFTDPLETILQSSRALAIVKGFSNNKAIEPLCRKCQFKTRFL